MPNTPFDMQMIIREMMHPDRHSRPSAEDLLKKRQLLSDEQRQLIVERNKANAANTALDAQMVRFIYEGEFYESWKDYAWHCFGLVCKVYLLATLFLFRKLTCYVLSCSNI